MKSRKQRMGKSSITAVMLHAVKILRARRILQERNAARLDVFLTHAEYLAISGPAGASKSALAAAVDPLRIQSLAVAS